MVGSSPTGTGHSTTGTSSSSIYRNVLRAGSRARGSRPTGLGTADQRRRPDPGRGGAQRVAVERSSPGRHRVPVRRGARPGAVSPLDQARRPVAASIEVLRRPGRRARPGHGGRPDPPGPRRHRGAGRLPPVDPSGCAAPWTAPTDERRSRPSGHGLPRTVAPTASGAIDVAVEPTTDDRCPDRRHRGPGRRATSSTAATGTASSSSTPTVDPTSRSSCSTSRGWRSEAGDRVEVGDRLAGQPVDPVPVRVPDRRADR